MLAFLGMRRKTLELSEQQKEIIRLLQGDIPVCETPFGELAEKIGISEDSLLDNISEMKSRGILRRFGATLRHQKVGFRANAMSVWKVPRERLEEVGRILASLPQVTHCYEREPRGEFPYNLYAMIHGRSRQECHRIAREVAERSGLHDYLLLFSSRESKKESMHYF